MYIVITGGGKVGEYLATVLLKSGNEVAIIERRAETADRLSMILQGRYLIIRGDGCDSKYQEDAGIRKADVFVAATGQDDNNLVACEIASRVYGVSRAIARVNAPKNQRIFRALGIESISSTEMIANLIEEETLMGTVGVVTSLTHGNVVLSEIPVPHMNSHDNDEGISIYDIEMPENSIIAAVSTKDDVQVVGGAARQRPDQKARHNVGGVVDTEINARDAHEHAEEQRRPAHTLFPEQEHGRAGAEGRRRVAGGKALVTLGVHADKLPELIVYAALVRIGPGARDEHLETAVCHQRAEQKTQAHGRSEAAGGFVKGQQQGEHDQKRAALSEDGDKLKEWGKKAAAEVVEMMYGGSHGGVKGSKGAVDPKRRSGFRHGDLRPFRFFLYFSTARVLLSTKNAKRGAGKEKNSASSVEKFSSA